MQEADSSRDAQLIERTNNMLQEAMSECTAQRKYTAPCSKVDAEQAAGVSR
jgi:hypothetical protein